MSESPRCMWDDPVAPCNCPGAGPCPSDGSPACATECGTFLVEEYRKLGVEANVSWRAPIVDTGYEPLNMLCPHGVKWYAEPTSEQIAKWARDGVA